MSGCSTDKKESREEQLLWLYNNVKAPSDEMRRGAKQGNAVDQFDLGERYFALAESKFKTALAKPNEKLTEAQEKQRRRLQLQTYETAKEWLIQAADQDYLQAQTAMVRYFLSEKRRQLYLENEKDKSIEYKMKPVWKKSLGLKDEDREGAINWCERAGKRTCSFNV